MNHAIHHSNHPESNIAAQQQPQPAHWGHGREVIAHALGEAFKGCAKSGNREAA